MYTARIRMPRMGTSVHESTVVAWKKAVGDAVAKGEVLLSAESDKVEFEVEAPADGVITEILTEAEQTVPVGEVLATMETETEVADETSVQDTSASDDWAAPVAPLQPREKPVIPPPQARKAPLPSDKKTWLSPRVQNLAAAHGVGLDVLAGIEGTGAGGRVRARDVEAFIAGGGIPPRIEMSSEPLSENRDERAEPLSRIRKRIAENLTRSVREIPQVTSWLDVDMGGVSAFRDANKQAFYDKHGCRLTYTPFFIMAIVHALRNADNERFNTTFADDSLTIKRFVNLGVAVDSPGGLVVPVLKSADSMNLVELSARLEDLAARAREGALSPDDAQGGTLTLTNFGASGALGGNPLINPPEVAIIGAGAIAPRPVALPNGATSVRPMMTLAITFDHRVNDGMAAGRFISDIRAALENMNLSLLEY